jgi:hypothetical protein
MVGSLFNKIVSCSAVTLPISNDLGRLIAGILIGLLVGIGVGVFVNRVWGRLLKV